MKISRSNAKPLEAERRRELRVATFGFAEICNEHGTPLIEATIRQISNHGACLRLKSAALLPKRLIIRLQPDQVSNRARLKWMSGVSIGIEFENTPQIREGA